MAVSSSSVLGSGLGQSISIASWVITDIIIIFMVGAIILVAGFILIRVLGIGKGGLSRGRKGDVKLIIYDESTVKELWGWWTKINNVVAAVDTKTHTVYVTTVLHGSRSYYDAETGAPVYVAKATSILDSGVKYAIEIQPRDVITDSVVSNIYQVNSPASATVTSGVDEQSGAVSSITPSAINQLLNSLEYYVKVGKKSSKVIELRPSFKVALAGNGGAIIDYLTNQTHTYVASTVNTIFPILQQIEVLKRVPSRRSDTLIYILMIGGALLLIYYILSRTLGAHP